MIYLGLYGSLQDSNEFRLHEPVAIPQLHFDNGYETVVLFDNAGAWATPRSKGFDTRRNLVIESKRKNTVT